MKRLIILFFSMSVGVSLAGKVEWTDESRRIEAAQVALWESKLAEAQGGPSHVRPAKLWLGLKNMGYRRQNYDGHSPAVDAIYFRLQQELLSNPNHARYFADEIKREQKEVARYPTNTGPRVSYDSHRSSYFQTLSLLPSPETISVLGDFLSDDIDTPLPLFSPDSDWGENPRANSFSASFIIMNIGLRNPPMAKGTYDADPDAHLAKTRAWWEMVKSGELTFSFLGQKVEYRFKPNGDWETIALANPPNDAPEATKAKDSNEERSAKRPSQPTGRLDHPLTTSWIWILGGLLLAGTIGYWAWRKHVAGPK